MTVVFQSPTCVDFVICPTHFCGVCVPCTRLNPPPQCAQFPFTACYNLSDCTRIVESVYAQRPISRVNFSLVPRLPSFFGGYAKRPKKLGSLGMRLGRLLNLSEARNVMQSAEGKATGQPPALSMSWHTHAQSVLL